jgi:hypothetical protein
VFGLKNRKISSDFRSAKYTKTSPRIRGGSGPKSFLKIIADLFFTHYLANL